MENLYNINFAKNLLYFGGLLLAFLYLSGCKNDSDSDPQAQPSTSVKIISCSIDGTKYETQYGFGEITGYTTPYPWLAIYGTFNSKELKLDIFPFPKATGKFAVSRDYLITIDEGYDSNRKIWRSTTGVIEITKYDGKVENGKYTGTAEGTFSGTLVERSGKASDITVKDGKFKVNVKLDN